MLTDYCSKPNPHILQTRKARMKEVKYFAGALTVNQ